MLKCTVQCGRVKRDDMILCNMHADIEQKTWCTTLYSKLKVVMLEVT